MQLSRLHSDLCHANANKSSDPSADQPGRHTRADRSADRRILDEHVYIEKHRLPICDHRQLASRRPCLGLPKHSHVCASGLATRRQHRRLAKGGVFEQMGNRWAGLRRRISLVHIRRGRFQLRWRVLGNIGHSVLCQPLPAARLHSELCHADANTSAHSNADPVERAHNNAPDAAAVAISDTLPNARTNVGSDARTVIRPDEAAVQLGTHTGSVDAEPYALANTRTNVGSYALANAPANVGS